MKNNSTMEESEYLFTLIRMELVALCCFRNWLFRCLPDMTYVKSRGILWVMVVSFILFGTFVLFRYMRTGWTAATCIILPFGLYTVLAYGAVAREFIRFAIITAVAVSAVYTAWLMNRKIRKTKKRGRYRIGINRLYKCLCFSQLCFAAVFLVIMFFFAVHNIFYASVRASVKAVKSAAPREQLVNDNMDAVLLLREEKWTQLSLAQRVDVLQHIANMEAHDLGLPNELNVKAAELGDSIHGCYYDQTRTIYISLARIKESSAHSALSALCHEAFHSYEYRLIDQYSKIDENARDLKMYRRISQYAAELSEYTYGNEDFSKYFDQYCEVDSRDYAKKAVSGYYRKISEYQGGSEEEKQASE